MLFCRETNDAEAEYNRIDERNKLASAANQLKGKYRVSITNKLYSMS